MEKRASFLGFLASYFRMLNPDTCGLNLIFTSTNVSQKVPSFDRIIKIF